jgi:hypothetical protein
MTITPGPLRTRVVVMDEAGFTDVRQMLRARMARG